MRGPKGNPLDLEEQEARPRDLLHQGPGAALQAWLLPRYHDNLPADIKALFSGAEELLAKTFSGIHRITAAAARNRPAPSGKQTQYETCRTAVLVAGETVLTCAVVVALHDGKGLMVRLCGGPGEHAPRGGGGIVCVVGVWATRNGRRVAARHCQDRALRPGPASGPT